MLDIFLGYALMRCGITSHHITAHHHQQQCNNHKESVGWSEWRNEKKKRKKCVRWVYGIGTATKANIAQQLWKMASECVSVGNPERIWDGEFELCTSKWFKVDSLLVFRDERIRCFFSSSFDFQMYTGNLSFFSSKALKIPCKLHAHFISYTQSNRP